MQAHRAAQFSIGALSQPATFTQSVNQSLTNCFQLMFFSNFPATASGSFLGTALTLGFLCDSAGGSFLFFTTTRLAASEGSIARLRELIIFGRTRFCSGLIIQS